MKATEKKPMAPSTITLKVDGEKVGEVVAERTVPAIFTASETFDVGEDLMSPVALDYSERTPFPFDGEIHRITVRYVD